MPSHQNLNGKRILVTRPAQQAHNLISLIEQHGGQAIAFPTLEIVALENTNAIKQPFENLKTYQWLIFISANAVNFAVAANNGKIAGFTQAKIAAVGKATAKASELAGLHFDEFNYRLKEHFGIGYIFDDSVILEDIELLKSL